MPKWKPGQTGNAGGRPGGQAGFSRLLKERTGNGQLLLDAALSIVSDTDAPASVRLQAIAWCADRMLGRTVVSVATEVTHRESAEQDLLRLGVAELEQLHALVAKLESPEGEVVDAELVAEPAPEPPAPTPALLPGQSTGEASNVAHKPSQEVEPAPSGRIAALIRRRSTP